MGTLLEYVRAHAGRLLIAGASLALDSGPVQAIGTHDELVAGAPLYREPAASRLIVSDADAGADAAS